MEDVNISKYRAQVVRAGSTPASPGFVVSEGQNPVDPSGSGQNHLPVTIATAATGLSITESQVLGGAGTVGQYIRGDGSLADFPATTGGGSSVSYYLNGSVSQGTIGGVAYKELNRTPVFGAGTDISINADGYIASFITDALDPNKLLIPGGNWNFETYFSASSSGGSPSFYVELYKYDGITFTLLATSSSSPELIAFGTNLNPYFSTLAVPETVLALTDRLAVRFYVTHSGRTITLHTEDNHLCQVITTFTTGLTALNGLTSQVQFFAVGTSGTDFAISSASDTHTFNLPTASATNRGALSSADWSTFNNKQNALTNPVTGTGTTNYLAKFTGTSTIGNSTLQEVSGNLGLGVNPSSWSQFKSLEIGTTGNGISGFIGASSVVMQTNAYWNGTNWIYANTANSAQIEIQGGNIIAFKQATSGTAGNVITYSQPLTITSGGNVGINTANPSAKLAIVVANSALNQAGFDITNTLNASFNVSLRTDITEIIAGGTGNLLFTNTSERMRITSGGVVGIGSTTPPSDSRLTLRATTSTGYNLFIEQDNGLDGFVLASTSAHGALTFSRRDTSGTNTVERLRLTAGGNLLVGTITDAGFKLDVNGTGRFIGPNASGRGQLSIQSNNASNAAKATWYYDTTQQGEIGTTSGDFYALAVNKFLFYAGGDERMRIDSNGTMILGGTSTTGTAGTGSGRGNLILAGSTSNKLTFNNNSTTVNGYVYSDGSELQISSAAGFMNFYTGNTERMRITSGGNVLIGTTTDNGPRLQVAPSASSWISGTFAGTGGTNKVVIGNFSGAAAIGAHSAALDAWANLAINFGGGNVLIGTTTSGASKLRIVGLPTSAAGLSSGDVYNLSGVLMIA
jgi:hypothetical protein